MRPKNQLSIHLDDNMLARVKETADRLGLSMNKTINIALCLQLPLDFSDLVYYYTDYIPEQIQKPASPF